MWRGPARVPARSRRSSRGALDRDCCRSAWDEGSIAICGRPRSPCTACADAPVIAHAVEVLPAALEEALAATRSYLERDAVAPILAKACPLAGYRAHDNSRRSRGWLTPANCKRGRHRAACSPCSAGLRSANRTKRQRCLGPGKRPPKAKGQPRANTPTPRTLRSAMLSSPPLHWPPPRRQVPSMPKPPR